MNQREIKFRAWDKEAKNWAPLNLSDWGSWQGASMSQNYPKGKPNEFQLVNDDYYEWVQFTGLKDKNGKEIYEGDILAKSYGKVEPLMVGEKAPEYEVQFHKGHFIGRSVKPVGSPDYLSTLADDFEVIGNIYENPELLKSPHAIP